MKMRVIICLTIFMILIGCFAFPIRDPDQCSICHDLPRHALCVVNLSTGEKLELDIYEPHPFVVGEIAKEQPGGYFCLIRGAGVTGHKIAAEYIEITVPMKPHRMVRQYFCISCRNRIASATQTGFVLIDIFDPENPVIYPIDPSISLSVRCYSVSIQESSEGNEYILTIAGHYLEDTTHLDGILF